MSDEWHPNVTRVVQAAAARGLSITPVRFPEGAKTAVDAANAIGVHVGQIVKSLIFAVDGEVKGNLANAFLLVTPLLFVGAGVLWRGRNLTEQASIAG